MVMLQPDAQMIVAETGRKCRIGLIARDGENGFWGLTARHVFAGLDGSRVKGPDGTTLGAYSNVDNASVFAPDHASSQIARFRLLDSAISPDRIAAGVTWPRSVIDEHSALGSRIVANDPSGSVIGTIVAIDSSAPVGFADGDQLTMAGATVVRLEDQSLLRPGLAGMLLVAQSGEAVGIAFAARREDHSVTMIASPLTAYLETTGLRLWAPSGAHWSDLSRRARDFLREVTNQGGPDLGEAPVRGDR